MLSVTIAVSGCDLALWCCTTMLAGRGSHESIGDNVWHKASVCMCSEACDVTVITETGFDSAQREGLSPATKEQDSGLRHNCELWAV